jgi:hypothetical protein
MPTIEGPPDRNLYVLRTVEDTDMIMLKREALTSYPKNHPNRFMSCANFANSLWEHYQSTGDVGLLDEAIDLQRETLDLCPAGHTDHSTCSRNLANSL